MDCGKERAAIRAGCRGLEREDGQDGDSLRVDERLRGAVGHCSYEHVQTLRLRCSQKARSSAAAFSNPQLRYAEHMGSRLRHERHQRSSIVGAMSCDTPRALQAAARREPAFLVDMLCPNHAPGREVFGEAGVAEE